MSILKEIWHGNICPQTDSRNNSPEMKELIEYMARHHDDLLKTMTDEQKEIFEKFDDCWSEYMSLGEAAIFEYAFNKLIECQRRGLSSPFLLFNINDIEKTDKKCYNIKESDIAF